MTPNLTALFSLQFPTNYNVVCYRDLVPLSICVLLVIVRHCYAFSEKKLMLADLRYRQILAVVLLIPFHKLQLLD